MYLLDTNICIYIMNKRSLRAEKKIMSLPVGAVKLSAVSLGELEFGVAKSLQRERNKDNLLRFISDCEILPFDDNAAEIFGYIRADLAKRGQPIGPYDLQIAAQALAGNLTLVTNNTAEFVRIKGLKIENWL
jgi:tRNA(fMet)-specific endonuclease VapC